jgi:N-glycosylase/DNA lyase
MITLMLKLPVIMLCAAYVAAEDAIKYEFNQPKRKTMLSKLFKTKPQVARLHSGKYAIYVGHGWWDKIPRYMDRNNPKKFYNDGSYIGNCTFNTAGEAQQHLREVTF